MPEILQCRKCLTGFLTPEIIPYQPESYYQRAENYAGVLLQPYRLKNIRDNAREILKIIRHHVQPWHKTLLDIGAHTGFFVREAQLSGFDALGIELNTSAVAWAQERGISVVQGTLQNLSEGKTFDVITIFHVLEHISNPIALLHEIRHRLNTNGLLCIEVPNFNSYLARKDGPAWKFIALEHLFYFSDQGISSMLTQLGFSIICIRKRNYELNDLNIRKLLHYFWGPSLKRKRLVMKSHTLSTDKTTPESILRKLLKGILIAGITLLGRQDHIFIIAQNSHVNHQKN